MLALPYMKSALLLAKKTGWLLLLYALCRLLFYWFNHSSFSDLHLSELLSILFFSVRFDLSVIILSNALFIALYLLPFPIRERKWYRITLKTLFIAVNSIAILANCADLIYFQFTLKRTTADVFHFFDGEAGNDLGRLLPLFLKDYWYIFIIWIIFSFLLVVIYNKTEDKSGLSWTGKTYFYQSLQYVFVILLSVVLYRGGFQLKPITIVDAGEYTSSKNIPLMVSTPFTILKTLELDAIEPTIFFEEEAELKKHFNPIHTVQKQDFKKLNVFVIILESFSKEYIGAINNRKEGYTPFLDSLIGQSYVYTNAFANGKKSIEGVPSIIASIPAWMNEPYITSPYGGNRISCLASLLKEQGYYTSFFHGGTNGTMGFEAFSHLCGYDDYYGRTEYNNEKDYDGNWGIWDEEFFQYTANMVNKQQQPFISTLFTLTSHHPYPVPDRYKDKFKEGPLPIERSIGYSDYALKRFFETASKMPWYNNTLFVLCADHTGISADPFYANRVGSHAIPVIYYLPGSDLKGVNATVTQQLDIMPSILDYLNFPKSHFSFGKSVFDTLSAHHAITFNSGMFQIMNDNYVLQFDGEKTIDLFNYKTDSLLQNDLKAKEPEVLNRLELKIKAAIQSYQQSLINNKMSAE